MAWADSSRQNDLYFIEILSYHRLVAGICAGRTQTISTFPTSLALHIVQGSDHTCPRCPSTICDRLHIIAFVNAVSIQVLA
ncbi:uncharacterized protein ARMOST_15398 [Armillaria ostoyae]|uniref:Uncharacterized protein n=1 Tax=Armillaria ostoyae TaxID=47428 RepID=A0A284RTB5_ARMOS|nr:uncharacterized protein ARMOST_15398 [Armillaria ostoyae]